MFVTSILKSCNGYVDGVLEWMETTDCGATGPTP